MKFKQYAAAALAAVMLTSASSSAVCAFAKVSEADKQKVEQQITQNESDLAAIKAQLEKLKKESAEAISIKQQLDAAASVLQDNIDQTVELIATYRKGMEELILEISEKQKEVDEQYEDVKIQLRSSYENKETNYLEIVFSSTSLSEMLSRSERALTLASYQENRIRFLEAEKSHLATLRTRLEEDLVKAKELEASLQNDKAELDANIEEANRIVKWLDSQTSEAQKQQAAFEKAEKDLEAKLQYIIEELERQAQAGMAEGDYLWPVKTQYRRISSYYGYRADPFTGETRFHNGIDIPCVTGEPVFASNNGTVVDASYNSSYGYYVLISHGDGILTMYAHNSKLLVSVGQVVKKGEQVAKAGSTGRSTGPHVHFEMRIDGSRVNPLATSNRSNAYIVQPK